MYSRTAKYEQEDSVWHAWSAICHLYFSDTAPTSARSCWAVDREAYRGVPSKGPSRTKPNLIAVQLTTGQPTQSPFPPILTRDYLWIECKAASENNPSGWKSVLAKAANRLSTAHPNKEIFLIIAVGWHCAFFTWDPVNQVPRLRLSIKHTKGNGVWPISPNIRAAGATPWINPNSGVFDPRLAVELDCFNFITPTILKEQKTYRWSKTS